MKKILIVGSANVDLSIHVKQIPAVGETVLGKKHGKTAGREGRQPSLRCGKIRRNRMLPVRCRLR